MRRLYAAFGDREDADDAAAALRDADFDAVELVESRSENPYFDPTATVPEVRGWLWGGLLGGVVGAVVLFALATNVFWIPRLSPMMTAGPYALVFMGFGVGAAVGGFTGGVIGLTREISGADRPELVVTVPDHRVGAATDSLRDHGAMTIEDTVTHHAHPQRERIEQRGRADD